MLREILGFLLTALAAYIGYESGAELFLTIGAVFGTVYVLTDLLKQYVPAHAQLLSWGIGMAAAMAAWWMGLGIFADMTWWFSLGTGFIVSLGANGIYDSQWLESLWRLIREVIN